MFLSAVFFCALFHPSLFALNNSTGPNGSNVQAVWSAETGYTGQGVAVGLISEGHTRLTHEAFTGINPNNWYDATGNNTYSPSWHDTPVGGIICSRGGAAYPNDKGAAPGAELYTVKVVDGLNVSPYWIIDGLDYLLDQNARVVVTAIQLVSSDPEVQPNGDSFFSLIYDYYAYQHNLVFATAAGNFQSQVTIFGDTFNGITTGGLFIDPNGVYYQVGAINDSGSNSGPTTDGRKKPEIVAPSQKQWFPYVTNDTSWVYIKDVSASYDDRGQTSWAVPHTGGVAAVLLSHADTTSDTADNENEVIKAVIVNSAFPNILDKAGNFTIDFLDADWPWNTDRGYGRIDAYHAYEILSSPKITPSDSTTNAKGWAYDAVSSGQQDTFTISGIKNERLLITLTWNRRVEWIDQKTGFPPQTNGIIDPGELTPYLANLDLEIRDPNGLLISPTASAIDNLEKVDLLLTKSGDYEIRVVYQSGSVLTNYGLAFELLPPLEADFNIDYVVNTPDLALFAQHWLDTDCLNSAQPCFDYNLAQDDSINLTDFSVFANRWLDFDPRYYTP